MVNKELRKLSRRELMDIIYQMKKNEQQMQEEIDSLRESLQDKRIRLSMAGSIAEAAASITNVFSAAQATADLYLHEISCMKEETEKERARIIEEANAAAARILSNGGNRFGVLQAEAQVLEEMEKHELHEGVEHGKENKE